MFEIDDLCLLLRYLATQFAGRLLVFLELLAGLVKALVILFIGTVACGESLRWEWVFTNGVCWWPDLAVCEPTYRR